MSPACMKNCKTSMRATKFCLLKRYTPAGMLFQEILIQYFFFPEPRRRKIRKILLPILLLLKVKAIIIIPIVLTVIGLVAMKGLGAALTALTISAFTALKGILDGKQTTEKRVTYGVIPPYLAHEPHWSRAGPTSLDYPELDPYYRTLPRGQ